MARRTASLAVLLLAAMGGLQAAPPPGSAEAEIHALQARQVEAWNRHDAAAYAGLFHDDGEVVNVVGWWWQGRAAIESKLTAAFSYTFRDSVMTITAVAVKLLSPTIAIAHVQWTMTGARTPPGVPEPRQGIQLQVLEKRDGEWRITSFQNTSSVPEVAFPAAPPPEVPAP